MSGQETRDNRDWVGRAILFAAFAVTSVIALLPLWSVRYLPFLDMPQHLSVIHVLSNYDNPAFRYQEFLELSPSFTTYLTYYKGAAMLANFMTVEAANKVLLSLAVVGLPASLMFTLRAFGRNPWLGFLGFPVAYSFPMFMGFASYALGIPVMFLAIGVWEGMLLKPTRTRQVLAALVLPLVFFTHALVFLMALGAVGLLTLLHCYNRPLTFIKRGLLLLLGVAVFLYWHVSMSQYGDLIGGAEPPPGTEVVAEINTQYRPLDQKLGALGSGIITFLPEDTDEVYLVLWVFLFLGYFLLRRRPEEAENEGAHVRRPKTFVFRYRVEILAWVLCALYFVAPITVNGVWAVSPRLPMVAACGLILTLHLPAKRRWQLLAFVPAVLLACAHPWHIGDHFEAFQEEVGPLDEVLAQIPDGQKLYPLIYDMGSAAAGGTPFIHFGSYYMLEHGGLTSFSFAQYPATPIRYRHIEDFPNAGERAEWTPHRFRYELYGASYDYFLVRDSSNPGRRLSRERENLELVVAEGQWAVFRNLGADGTHRRIVSSLRRLISQASVRLLDAEGNATDCSTWNGSRWQCPQADWIWVGDAVVRSSGLEVPCIWAHPYSGHTLEIVFPEVELANELSGFITIADPGIDVGEAPVDVDMHLDGRLVWHTTRENVRGREAFSFDTSDRAGSVAEVGFRIHTEQDGGRHFCFDASTLEITDVD